MSIERRALAALAVLVVATALVLGWPGHRGGTALAAPARSQFGVVGTGSGPEHEVRPHRRSKETRGRPRFGRPLGGAVTSFFGPRDGGEHTGLDIEGITGDVVVAAAAGHVIHAGPYYGYGQTIIIDHGLGYTTLYGHLSRMRAGVGRSVEEGEAVGRVGCTGDCTGDHLHFEIRIREEPVDPLPFLRRGARPRHHRAEQPPPAPEGTPAPATGPVV